VFAACVRVESGTDPEPLGYGPGPEAMLAWGYDGDPAPRPAPSPWVPPRQFARAGVESSPAASGPVAYNDDLVRVCAQLQTLAGADPGFDGDACLAQYRVERVFRPLAEWKRLAACVGAATEFAGADACASASPRVFGPIPEYPRESAVCMHIFALTIVEQLGAEPMLDSERIAQFAPLLRECVDSLVVNERSDRKPAEYLAMLACIEQARTTAVAEACE
jgi:hypothetical protein